MSSFACPTPPHGSRGHLDYLIGRQAIVVGGRRLVVTVWLRDRKLELALKRARRSSAGRLEHAFNPAFP
jgi:hypothetical protein